MESNLNKIIILIPTYNDWESLFKLLKNIDLQISLWESAVSILVVNDASTEAMPQIEHKYKNIRHVTVINMKINRGHARCNAAGLKYITEKEQFTHVILMDGDGEDRPEELNLFYNKLKKYPNKVITANRVKRAENFFFKFCYLIHKNLTFVFTGELIKFGNYSCLPKSVAINMSFSSSTWSSFSGSLAKLIKDRVSIPSVRGSRYFAQSKMGFLNLVKHSLSIIAVFKNIVIIRSIIFLLVYFFFIYQTLSIVTLIPVFFILFLIFVIISLSKRENINEMKDSLQNIKSIKKIS